MNWLINLYVQWSGLWDKIHDLVPLLAGIGSILGAAGSMCLRAGHSTDAASLLQALHPTAQEGVDLALGWGLIKQHLKHEELLKP